MLAICVPEKEKKRNKNVPTNSPRPATSSFLMVEGTDNIGSRLVSDTVDCSSLWLLLYLFGMLKVGSRNFDSFTIRGSWFSILSHQSDKERISTQLFYLACGDAHDDQFL